MAGDALDTPAARSPVSWPMAVKLRGFNRPWSDRHAVCGERAKLRSRESTLPYSLNDQGAGNLFPRNPLKSPCRASSFA